MDEIGSVESLQLSFDTVKVATDNISDATYCHLVGAASEGESIIPPTPSMIPYLPTFALTIGIPKDTFFQTSSIHKYEAFAI